MDNLEISKMNIYQKLVEVRKKVEFLKKEEGKQYAFVSSSKVLIAIREYLNEYNLLLIPECIDSDMITHEKDKNGNIVITYFTKAKMTMTWVNCDIPSEKFTVKWEGHGVDIAGEKGIGKAYTYAEKYFLLKQFNIPTDKLDPDVISNQVNNDNNKQNGLQKEYEILKAENEVMKEEYRKLAGNFKVLKTKYQELEAKKEPEPEHEAIGKQEENNKSKSNLREELETKIQNILFLASGKKLEKVPELLEKHSAFTGKDGIEVNGEKDIKKLSDGRIQATYGKLQAVYPDIYTAVKETFEKRKREAS